MRIGIDIHAIGARQTGNETYITNLVETMLETAKPDMEFFLYHTREVELPDWPVTLRIVRPHNPLLRIPMGFPLGLRADGIDVAHFQYVIPPITPCPTVVTIHDISYEFFPAFFNRLSRFRMRTLIPLAARKSRFVLTVSRFSKDEIIRKYRIPEEKVIVTYNGVAERFQEINDDGLLAEQTARFQLERPFLLSVGTLNPRKNLPLLIKAYASLKKRGRIEQDLVLVGPESYKAHEVYEEVKKQGLEGNVIATGHVSNQELVALYNRADIFVYPSIYEGFGLPVVEAMACGTPVVTSNSSCIPEIAGNAAILTDPYSQSELESALLNLADNHQLREEMAEKGRERARFFTWKKTAEATLSAYNQALG